MAMTIHTLDAKPKLRLSALGQLLRVWVFSSIFNAIGAISGAWVITYCSGVFQIPNSQQQKYLVKMGESKVTGRSFCANFVLAIGCNMLVCLATWTTVGSKGGAGKILAIWFTIGIFGKSTITS